MSNEKRILWALKIGVAGEFMGHGVLALSGKADWIGWIQQLSGFDAGPATAVLLIVGFLDILLALMVLIRPVRPLILWMAFWGFFTAILRPIVGYSFWDFVERSANWGAPLALYFLLKKKE